MVMDYWHKKQYWADASTQNCVWQFQVMNEEYPNGCQCEIYDEEGDLLEGKTQEDKDNCRCYIKVWHTEAVFLTQQEAEAWGNSRPYVWGKQNKGWRIYGVPCWGLMPELLSKHTEEFKDKVEYTN